MTNLKVKIQNLTKLNQHYNLKDSNLTAIHLAPKEISQEFDENLVSAEMKKLVFKKELKIIGVPENKPSKPVKTEEKK